MTYGPAVKKQCEYCKKEYMCPNHRAHKPNHCSITCSNKSRRFKRVEYTCVSCKDVFLAVPDHGAARKFCSRKCFLAECIRPADKECKNCGCVFTAARANHANGDADGRKMFCSKKCYTEHSHKFEEKPCAWCGTLFYPISAERNITQSTCSMACRAKYFSGANAVNFKGGTHIQAQANHRMVLLVRPGFVAKYTAEHRILIAKHIGRLLTRSETVIHINNQGLDNRLANLYVCESMSEFGKRKTGGLPWPTESNVDQLKEKT